ncbi:hypothetical protein A7R75_11475 [Mycolicibacterium llatzerense]|nr:hypothetical protein [Mycolicibacterium llatzerense]
MRIKPRPERAPEKRTRRQIIRGWFNEESFYRDITTRSLSAGLVTLVAYLGAVTLGYIGKPPVQAVVAVGALAVAASIGLGGVGVMNRGRRALGSTIIVGGISAVVAGVYLLEWQFGDSFLERVNYWLGYLSYIIFALTFGLIAIESARAGVRHWKRSKRHGVVAPPSSAARRTG